MKEMLTSLRLKFKLNRWQWFTSLALSVMLFAVFLPHRAIATPQQDLQRLDAHITQAITQTEAKDYQQAATAFEQYRKDWFEVEDGVKATSRQAYKEIEAAMGDVSFALSTQPPDSRELLKSLNQLHQLDQKFVAGGFSAAQAAPHATQNAAAGKVTVSSLLDRLNRAETALNNQNIATAAAEIKQFQTEWLEVEGVVAAKSKQAYVSIENNMAKAAGFLNASTPDVASAQTAIAELKQSLQPYAGEELRYTLLDATLILLREGVEALLVLVALLAFLNKSGNGEKGHWLWVGTGAGVLASFAVAIVFQVFFSNLAAAGANRELLEGFTGIVAAAMLFYVSYWLHSKSSLKAWQGYIRNQATSALAKNSVFSLSLLAFLAVFREGGETVLFYMGIAPSISPADLIGGLVLGSVILVLIAALILGFGLKIPLQPFFLVTSLLIYYLGFKFIGSGIHALQVAGMLPANPANFLPSSDFFGIYPTWETTLVQLALLLVGIAIVLRNRFNAARSVA